MKLNRYLALLFRALITITIGSTFPVFAEKYAVLAAVEDYSAAGASNLPGCINDMKAVEAMLVDHFDFPRGNIVSLADSRVSKQELISALRKLVAKAAPGDVVVFYFSGHGTQVPDLNDDEDDRLDEVLVTADFDFQDENSWLRDDDLRAIFSGLRTKRALVMIDACHSGTGTRGMGSDGVQVIEKQIRLDYVDMLGRGAEEGNALAKDAGPLSHVLISGSRANEYSALLVIDGVGRSLFTTALTEVLPTRKSAPLTSLETAIHERMVQIDEEAASKQNPQVETMVDVTVNVLIGDEVAATSPTPDQNVAEPNNPEPVQQPAAGLPSAFEVQVATDKRTYRSGEVMVARVKSEKDGYLRLYYVDKTGSATLIFPNGYQQDNRIPAGATIQVGAPDGQATANFRFRMKPPGGTEILLAAVSPQQFTDHEALEFSKEKPFIEMGKVESLRQLTDKAIEIEGVGGGLAPAQIGRAISIYEITD
ncbi:MAG: caspase family protein [Verrucomicrobiota bacterium]